MSDTLDCTQPVRRALPLWVYRTALITATMIWGGNFVVAKPIVESLGSFWVIGIRFICAATIMLVLSFNHVRRHINRQAIKAGVVIGLFAFLGFGTQFLGLEGTTPSRNAFLSACYCITTPFLWWLVAHKRPTKRNIACALICVVGIGLVSLQDEMGMSWGDGVSVLSAFLYGGEIIAIALFMGTNDVLVVTIVELIVAGILGCVTGVFVSGLPSVDVLTSPDTIWRLAYVVVLGTCFASTAQNTAQKHLQPAEIGLLCSLESVFGTLFSMLFYNEAITVRMMSGFALIFAAIAASEFRGRRRMKSDPMPEESMEIEPEEKVRVEKACES